jgi:AcrR family transcriptional regulator
VSYDCNMRADALRNRERILEAAATTFAEAGREAQMDEIARRAELGVGTLYRHFPTKGALLEALLLDRLERIAGEARAAREEEPTPWAAFARFVRAASHVQIADRALKDMLGGRVRPSAELAEKRIALHGLVGALVDDAQRSGELRADLSVGDLPILFSGLGATPWSASPMAPEIVDRFVDLILDGLRAPGRTPLRGKALSLEQVEEFLTAGCEPPEDSSRQRFTNDMSA